MIDKISIKEIKNLIALCKKENVKCVEINGIKIEFNPYAPKERRKTKASSQEPQVELPYSDEDALFWSSDPVV